MSTLNGAFTLAFVVGSMFSLGLGITWRKLIDPLKDIRLVGLTLVISFGLIPAVAYVVTSLLPLEQSYRIGLVLFSTVAGAPLGIKVTEIAIGDVPEAASLVVLQVIGTVVLLPLMLPVLIPGIELDSWALTSSLGKEVLLPLALGLFVNWRYDAEADMIRPVMTDVANVSLAGLLLVNLSRVPSMLSLFGTGAIFSVLVIIATGLAAGYFLNRRDRKFRRTLGLVSAQRNFAAAFVIAQGSFASDGDIFLVLLMASFVSMIVILLIAGEFRRHALRRRSFA